MICEFVIVIGLDRAPAPALVPTDGFRAQAGPFLEQPWRDVVDHVGDKACVAGMDFMFLDVDMEYPGLSCTDEEPIRIVDIDLVASAAR